MSTDDHARLLKELEAAKEQVRAIESKLQIRPNFEDVQDLLKLTVEQMLEGIQIVDFYWRYIYINDAAAAHGNSSRSKLLGQTMMESYPGIDQTEVFAALKSVMEERHPRRIENLFDLPGGKSVWFELLVEPHPSGILIRSMDITARKQIEQQYQHSQKMEAVGRLAGGIAHEFNNKLGIMTIFCEMILERYPDTESPAHTHAQKVLTAVEQAASLTRQLLAYSRKQVLNPKVINLNDQFSEMKNNLQKLLGEAVIIEFFPNESLGNVKVDPMQVDQVILNLCINARDAMPNGGTLTVETFNAELDSAYCASHPNLIPGDYILLSISDTGGGMAPEIRDRIFEPFFTTKDKNKGTGLGLSTVQGIINQSRGHIWLYSEPGLGTTFKIYFPRVQDAKDQKAPASNPKLGLEGTETILLVEDDQMLREAFEHSLHQAGYKVFAASDGEQAIAHFTRQKGKVDLLMTDVVLPKISGRDLANELRTRNKDLKVVFVSGYTENSIIHHGILDTESVLVNKPVSIRNLLKAIREVLDGILTKGVV